jgi:hypothetical protein
LYFQKGDISKYWRLVKMLFPNKNSDALESAAGGEQTIRLMWIAVCR